MGYLFPEPLPLLDQLFSEMLDLSLQRLFGGTQRSLVDAEEGRRERQREQGGGGGQLLFMCGKKRCVLLCMYVCISAPTHIPVSVIDGLGDLHMHVVVEGLVRLAIPHTRHLSVLHHRCWLVGWLV